MTFRSGLADECWEYNNFVKLNSPSRAGLSPFWNTTDDFGFLIFASNVTEQLYTQGKY